MVKKEMPNVTGSLFQVIPSKYESDDFFSPGCFSCSGAGKTTAKNRHAYNDSVNQQLWTADWSRDDRFIAVAGVDSTVRVYHAAMRIRPTLPPVLLEKYCGEVIVAQKKPGSKTGR